MIPLIRDLEKIFKPWQHDEVVSKKELCVFYRYDHHPFPITLIGNQLAPPLLCLQWFYAHSGNVSLLIQMCFGVDYNDPKCVALLSILM